MSYENSLNDITPRMLNAEAADLAAVAIGHGATLSVQGSLALLDGVRNAYLATRLIELGWSRGLFGVLTYKLDRVKTRVEKAS